MTAAFALIALLAAPDPGLADPGLADPGLTDPNAALASAIECYEQLDYSCAEARLAEALAGDLSPRDRVRALAHQALLSVAYQDLAGARRAVRTLYTLDPSWDPGPVPPALARVYREERPPPPIPPQTVARLDFTTIRLSGQDADRWTEGLGVEAAGGVRLFDRLFVGLALGYSDHRPLDFALEGLTLLTAAVEVGWSQPVGPVWITAGLAGGLARVDIDGVVQDDEYIGGWLQAPIDVAWPLYHGLGLGVRCAPGLFTTPDEGRLAGSWILPLTAGLRYTPEVH